MHSPCRIGFQYFPNANPISIFISTTNMIPDITDCEDQIIMDKPLAMIFPSESGYTYTEPYVYVNIESKKEMKLIITASFKNTRTEFINQRELERDSNYMNQAQVIGKVRKNIQNLIKQSCAEGT